MRRDGRTVVSSLGVAVEGAMELVEEQADGVKVVWL